VVLKTIQLQKSKTVKRKKFDSLTDARHWLERSYNATLSSVEMRGNPILERSYAAEACEASVEYETERRNNQLVQVSHHVYLKLKEIAAAEEIPIKVVIERCINKW